MADHSARDFFDWLGIVASVIAAIGTPVAIAMLYLMLRGVRASRTRVAFSQWTARLETGVLKVYCSIQVATIAATFTISDVEARLSYGPHRNIKVKPEHIPLNAPRVAHDKVLLPFFHQTEGEVLPATVTCTVHVELADGTKAKQTQRLQVIRS